MKAYLVQWWYDGYTRPRLGDFCYTIVHADSWPEAEKKFLDNGLAKNGIKIKPDGAGIAYRNATIE